MPQTKDASDAQRRARLRAQTLARKAINDLADIIEDGHLLAATGGTDLIVAATEEIIRLRAQVRSLQARQK